MSNYVWLAHSGSYDDHIVWGVFASVESWWDQVRLDFSNECPTVVPVSRCWGEGPVQVRVRPSCQCRRVKREGGFRSYGFDEWEHPHQNHFNSAGLFREEIQGQVSLVKDHQTYRLASGLYYCAECDSRLDTPHNENCPSLIEFKAPEYVHPKTCKWKKAGEKCTEDALDGDDQFCAPHLEKVLAGRAAREAHYPDACQKCGGTLGGNSYWCPPCSGAMTFPTPGSKS